MWCVYMCVFVCMLVNVCVCIYACMCVCVCVIFKEYMILERKQEAWERGSREELE